MTELPTGWTRASLGDVADTTLGKMLDRGHARGLPLVPYLRNVNVQWGRIDTQDVLTMELADGDRERFAVQLGDLLVCEGGEIGRAAIWHGRTEYLAFQKALHRIRSRGNLDLAYLRYLLELYRDDGTLERFATGSTIAHLPQQRLRSLPVPMPTLVEQRRIVDILEDHLSRLDAALTNLGLAGSRSERLLISALLGNAHVKAAPTQPLVGLLAEPLANGRSVPTLKGGFPVLRLTALKADGIDLTERKGGSWTEADARRFVVRRGDFLVSRGNGSLRLVARGAHVIDDPDPVAYPDTMIRIRMRPADIVPEYLHLVWNSPIVRRQIESMARTTAGIYKVNQKHLESVRIPVPRMEQQREVSEQVGQISAAANRLQDELKSATEHAESLRRALLAAAFSGCLTSRRSSDMEMVEEMAGV